MSFEKTQPSTKRSSLLKWAVAGCVVAAGYGTYRYASRIIKQDPLAIFKESRPDELPDTVAIRSTDTQFKHYDEGKPKTTCDVKTIEVAQNRQMYTFKGITNGRIEYKGELYQFEADRGGWNGFVKKLALSGDLKFKGKKFDLTSNEFNYDENRRLFTVPQTVAGTAFGGKLEAVSFSYNLESEAFKAGKGRWVGIPPEEILGESPVQAKRTIWDIKYNDIDHPKGDITYYTDARATDGEVIITAPKIEVNDKTDVMTATGRVRYFGTKANLIADKIVIYRKEKRALLTGNVTMLVKPKDKQEEPAKETELTPLPPAVPDSISATRPPAPDDDVTKKKEDEIRSMKNLRSYPLVVLAPKIEYWYKKGERRAIISGSPQARQDMPENGWRYVWSDHANYDGEKESLSLFSAAGKQDVILKNSVGDELYGESGVLSTKEDDDSYSFKKGRAKMPTRGDDDIPDSDKKGNTGGGGGATGKGGGIAGPIGRTRA